MNGSRSESGFILVSTIWLTLLLLLFAGVFNFFASSRLEQALASRATTADLLDRSATEQTLMYLFATSAVRRRGLEIQDGQGTTYVRLDGTIYQGFGDISFSLNDYAGLVGLNTENNYHLENLLREYESSGLERQGLLHALYDYIDLNDSVRLSGREAPAYRVVGLQPPTNDYLRSPVELTYVYGWQSWLADHPDFSIDWLSTNWRSRMNLNTVPEELMLKVLPLEESEVRRLIERRRVSVFSDMADVSETLNLRGRLDGDYFTFLPSGKVRFRMYSAKNSKLSTIATLFTPMSTTSPWETDYRYQSESEFDNRKSSRAFPANYFDR